MKLRWLIPRAKQSSIHDHAGSKWKNEWESYSQGTLQYSLDGKTWEDVECSYVDIPESERHLYQWDSLISNNKLSILK